MTPADNKNDDEFDDNLDDFSDEITDESLDYVDEGDYTDDEWDESADDELAADPAGALAAVRKKSKISNNMIIAGAVIVGLCVLAYQVVTTSPVSLQQFQSALNMTGSTEGPVFGNKPADEC